MKFLFHTSIAPEYLFHSLTNVSYALWTAFNDGAPYIFLIDCVYFYILLKEYI